MVRAGPGDWNNDLNNDIAKTRQATIALNKPGLTPDQKQKLVKQRRAGLQGIASVAADHPDDVQAQIAVTRGYTSVGEGTLGRATGDRAVLLAQATGSPKTLSTALAVSAAAYGASGDYATAAQRAKKALELDRDNKDAAFLYSEYKGRGSAQAAPAPEGGGAGGTPTQSRTAAGASASAAAATAARTSPAVPAAAMTNPADIRTAKDLAEGRRLVGLDPQKALASYDAAVKESGGNPRVRAERAQARLAAGDPQGALEDAQAAVDGGAGAPAYAVRAEAEKALGRPAAQVQADLARAASLDPGLAALYRQAVDRIEGPGGAKAAGAGGAEASGSGYGAAARLSPSAWLALAALAGVLLAGIAGFALWVKRRTQKAFESGDPPPLNPR